MLVAKHVSGPLAKHQSDHLSRRRTQKPLKMANFPQTKHRPSKICSLLPIMYVIHMMENCPNQNCLVVALNWDFLILDYFVCILWESSVYSDISDIFWDSLISLEFLWDSLWFNGLRWYLWDSPRFLNHCHHYHFQMLVMLVKGIPWLKTHQDSTNSKQHMHCCCHCSETQPISCSAIKTL